MSGPTRLARAIHVARAHRRSVVASSSDSSGRGRPRQHVDRSSASGGGMEAEPPPLVGVSAIPAAKRRDEKRALRQAAADLHPWDSGRNQPSRVHGCGRTVVGGAAVDAYIGKGTTGAASVHGVQSCARAWECAVCRARIGAMHLAEISAAADYWLDRPEGGRIYFLTLTVRHSRSDELRSLRAGLSRSWSRLVEGRAWQRFKVATDLEYVRAMDATLGASGWHLHFHALLFVSGPLETHRVKREIYERWASIVGRELGAENMPSKRHAVRLQTMKSRDQLPKYVAKLGMELTHDLGKFHDEEADEHEGFTPWEVLSELKYLRTAAAAATRADSSELAKVLNAEAVPLAAAWGAWWRGMTGCRWVTWSQKLRKLAGLGVELTDEEAAAVEEVPSALVARIPCELRKTVLHSRVILSALLDAIDRDLPLPPFIDAMLSATDAAIWHEANDPEKLARWWAERPGAFEAWQAQIAESRALARGAVVAKPRD